MIKRIYQLDELTESAEMLRSGPPWWLHAALFGLVFTITAAVAVLGRSLGGGRQLHTRPAIGATAREGQTPAE